MTLWSSELMGEQTMVKAKDAAATLGTADIIRVMKLLPHRYPFLMVDRMYDMKGDMGGAAAVIAALGILYWLFIHP